MTSSPSECPSVKENELKILQSDNITTIQRIDRLTSKGFKESVMTKDTFFSPQQLMDYGEDYNKGQLKVPLRAVYIAQKFGNKHPEGGVLTGLDILQNNKFKSIQNKNIGLVINHTSINKDKVHILDLLLE